MRYDFTLLTEDPKAWKKQQKNKESGEHTLLQNAHADMSTRTTRNQRLVLCGKSHNMFNEDLFWNQVKNILLKENTNKYKRK